MQKIYYYVMHIILCGLDNELSLHNHSLQYHIYSTYCISNIWWSSKFLNNFTNFRSVSLWMTHLSNLFLCSLYYTHSYLFSTIESFKMSSNITYLSYYSSFSCFFEHGCFSFSFISIFLCCLHKIIGIP